MRTYTKPICQGIKRATTDPRPRMKSSRQGASIGTGTQAPYLFLANYFEKQMIFQTKLGLFTVECAQSKALIPRFQVLEMPCFFGKAIFIES